jgi:glycosyltransferase involved in cell wall biosynthesis
MKILLAFYPIDDMGGIINHNEQLSAGLQELGHTVDTYCFVPREDRPRNGMAGGRGTISPYTGLEFDQRRGYSWPRAYCVPYMGKANDYARQLISSYDITIWQVAVPTKRKENRGNTDWELLYQTDTKNLAVIHDGNFLASYPWLSDVEEYLTGLICVHHCAFNSAKHISVPSSFIPNPQHITQMPDISRYAWDNKSHGFLSLQTFKAWKHVPELVAAMPYVSTGVLKFLAGKGIDYYYMTSKDKCKWPGIWDKAIDCGMIYLDVITNEKRDIYLKGLTCLVDPSWSNKYSQIGGHFNRVCVDAIMCGTLPVVRPLGISTNLEGSGELFKAGVNCVAIPQGATPQEYGEALSEACTLPYHEWSGLMENAVNLLPLFERKGIAMQVLELAGGVHQQVGVTTEAVKAAANKNYWEFFDETNRSQS